MRVPSHTQTALNRRSYCLTRPHRARVRRCSLISLLSDDHPICYLPREPSALPFPRFALSLLVRRRGTPSPESPRRIWFHGPSDLTPHITDLSPSPISAYETRHGGHPRPSRPRDRLPTRQIDARGSGSSRPRPFLASPPAPTSGLLPPPVGALPCALPRNPCARVRCHGLKATRVVRTDGVRWWLPASPCYAQGPRCSSAQDGFMCRTSRTSLKLIPDLALPYAKCHSLMRQHSTGLSCLPITNYCRGMETVRPNRRSGRSSARPAAIPVGGVNALRTRIKAGGAQPFPGPTNPRRRTQRSAMLGRVARICGRSALAAYGALFERHVRGARRRTRVRGRSTGPSAPLRTARGRSMPCAEQPADAVHASRCCFRRRCYSCYFPKPGSAHTGTGRRAWRRAQSSPVAAAASTRAATRR